MGRHRRLRRGQFSLDHHLDGGNAAVVEPPIQRLDDNRFAEPRLMGDLRHRPVNRGGLGGLAAVEVLVGGGDDLGPAHLPPLCGSSDPVAVRLGQGVGQRVRVCLGFVVVGVVRR